VRYQIIPRLASMATVWTLLLVWFYVGSAIGCVGTLLFLAVLSAILAMSGTEIAFYRRRAFLQTFLRSEGWMHRTLRSNAPPLVLELLKAVALALFLLVSALSFEPHYWALLCADVLLLSLLLPRIYAGLGEAASEQYRWVLARHWATWISAFALWVPSMFILVYATPAQNYFGLRWQEVVSYSAAQSVPSCPLVGDLARIGAIADALGTWGIQNLWRSLSHTPDTIMAIIAVIGTSVIVFLLAWTFNHALMGVLARPWLMWHIPPSGAPRA
jgi:hypothetical protein